MTPEMKRLITAIIAFIALAFGAYVAMTDNDPATNPDPQQIIDAGTDVYDAIQDVREKSAAEKAAEVATDAANNAGDNAIIAPGEDNADEPLPQPKVK